MKRWLVQIPLVGSVETEVSANTEEEALRLAIHDIGYVEDCDLDTANAEIELVEDDEDEE